MKADLHAHSYYSDGDLSPRELARYMSEVGADAFSLTDHDTMAGVDEACAAAEEFGLKFVPGVEISAYDGCDIHILGYYVDKNNPKFKKFDADMSESRRVRFERTLELLKQYGMPLDFDKVRSFAKRNPSRAHAAMGLVDAGYEPDMASCFDKWLRAGGPCYVPNDSFGPEEAVRLICDCGGIAVLAHPVRIRMNSDKLASYIKMLTKRGLSGIEASYKQAQEDVVKKFTEIGKANGLFITNGGDFHSPSRSLPVPREISESTAKSLRLL